ncbi:MAG TPA: hypothetical protein VGN00_29925 [Puia sp.]
MKHTLFAIALGALSCIWSSWSAPTTDRIAEGQQPQIAVDNNGIIRVAFGRKDKIFCVTSVDQGVTFSEPVLVADVPEMHLGMSRGPQLASSDHYSVITAMDKAGNIHWFRLNHGAKGWSNMGMINDVKGSSPEGLMSIAADKSDHFYAVWLDIRTGHRNQVYFSSVSGTDGHWAKNRLLYQSPDGHVCECCKPNIAAEGSRVAVMFRNWLSGSRDLYLLQSSDGGNTFRNAEKLGKGTWKLNGCPMDGGGVFIDAAGHIHTTWQREGTVYYCTPGEVETAIGKGRISSISGASASPVISMQHSDTVELVRLLQKKDIEIGTGSFLRSVGLPDSGVLCVWEQDNVIRFRKV